MITDWSKYLDRCRKLAILRGHKQVAEDFAQYAALRVFQGRKATVEQLLIDYLRSEYGCTGIRSNSKQLLKCNERKHATPIDNENPIEDFARRNSNHVRSFRDFEPFFKFISQIDRSILKLFYEWGFDESEIADCFGVTKSRICQRLQRVQSSLSKIIKKEESRISEKTESIQSAISSKKRQTLEFRTDKEMAKRESRGLENYFETFFNKWLT